MVVRLVVKLRGCTVSYFNDTPDLREEGLRRVVVGYALWKLCPQTAAWQSLAVQEPLAIGYRYLYGRMYGGKIFS